MVHLSTCPLMACCAFVCAYVCTLGSRVYDTKTTRVKVKALLFFISCVSGYSTCTWAIGSKKVFLTKRLRSSERTPGQRMKEEKDDGKGPKVNKVFSPVLSFDEPHGLKNKGEEACEHINFRCFGDSFFIRCASITKSWRKRMKDAILTMIFV